MNEPAHDRAGILGHAVALLALAGTCALLADHFLIGALRLAAGLLAGLGLGAAVLVAAGSRLSPRMTRIGAAAVALGAALALTLPAVLSTRLVPLADQAALAVPALSGEDRVFSVAAPGAPVLIRRAEGGDEVLSDQGIHPVDAAPEDLLALSADGSRVVHSTGETTRILAADGTEQARLDGAPLALRGDIVILRSCPDDGCLLTGIDLADIDAPLWTILEDRPADDPDRSPRGPDPAGRPVPARPEASAGLLEAARETGVIPEIPLRFDPAQGWMQLDPRTGFPLGEILAGPQEECRIAATGSVVLTLCSAEDGAMTATAYQEGNLLWESAPSPAGEWTVLLDAGRVLASGLEAGAGTEGEILASEDRADWSAPGGAGLRQATPFTSRIGIDGDVMVVANAAGQLLAYDTADGVNLWTLPLGPEPGSPVRGTLDASTALVVDEVERTHPLDPRDSQRIRVIDASTGAVRVEADTDAEIRALRALGDGRALVTTGEQTLLLSG